MNKEAIKKQELESELNSQELNHLEGSDSYEQNKMLIIEYCKKITTKEKNKIILFCEKWNGTNGIYFGAITAEDIYNEVITKILEGKRKCYLESYKVFRGSVYFHVKKALLSFFKCNNNIEQDKKLPKIITLNELTSENEDYEFDDIYFNNNFYFDGEVIFNEMEINELEREIFELFDENDENEFEEILVLKELLTGKKRNEIAEDLGITVNEVTNIHKRINRKLSKKFKINRGLKWISKKC